MSPSTAQAGRAYWENTTADVNGMLGGVPTTSGFSSVPRIDLQGSRTFLARLNIGVKGGRKPVANALEGGAGIGRVTEGLLLNIAEQVDVIEPVAKFTDKLRANNPGVRHVFNVGLEEWQPLASQDGEHGYDLVWVQWCLGHVTDEQAVRFLKLCGSVLARETGVIVVKENLSTSEDDLLDENDGHVTRPDSKFRKLFEEAGLRLVKTDLQRGFPELPSKRLLPVRMYALKAPLSVDAESGR